MLTMTVRFERFPEYLAAYVEGCVVPDRTEQIFGQIADEAARGQYTRVLMDCTPVLGTPAEADRRDMARFAIERFQALTCAILLPPEKITLVFQRAVAERGLRCRVMADRARALEWLLSA